MATRTTRKSTAAPKRKRASAAKATHYTQTWLIAPETTRSAGDELLQTAFSALVQANLGDATQQAAVYAATVTAWACVNARASAVASLNVIVASDADAELPISPAQTFVESAEHYLWLLTASLMVFGRAYLYKVRNEFGYPTGVAYLSPMDVIEQSDLMTGEPARYLLGMSQREIPRDDLIVLRLPSPLSSAYHVSPTSVVTYRALAERNLGEWAKQFFANSARPDGLLIFEGMITPEQLERQREAWQQMRSPSNAWKTFVAGSTQGGKWTWQPITPPPTDLAMRDLATEIRFDICAAFQVHPVLIGGTPSDPLSATSTYDAVWRNHLQNVALPTLRLILGALNAQWLQKDFEALGYALRLEPDLTGVNSALFGTPERFQSAAQGLASGILTLEEAREFVGRKPNALGLKSDPAKPLQAYQGGLLTLNEARRLLGYEPLPTGEVLLVNGNPTPIADIGKPLQPVLPLLSAEGDGSALTAEQLAELRAWRAEVLSRAVLHGDYRADFAPRALPEDVVAWIEAQLAAHWNPDEVFARAERLEIAQPIGAASGAAFWRELDASARGVQSLAQLFTQLQTLSEADYAALEQIVRETPESDLDAALARWFEAWLAEHGAAFESAFAEYLGGAYVLGVKAADGQLTHAIAKRDLTLSVDWQQVAQEAAAYALTQSATLVKQISQTTLQQLQRAIRDAVVQGALIADLRAAIARVFNVAGYPITQQLLNRAELIAITELTRVYAEGARERYKMAGVTRAIWQTAQDEDVCPICRARHNAVADIERGWRAALDGQFLTPPAHPRCRCFTLPYLEGVSDVG